MRNPALLLVLFTASAVLLNRSASANETIREVTDAGEYSAELRRVSGLLKNDSDAAVSGAAKELEYSCAKITKRPVSKLWPTDVAGGNSTAARKLEITETEEGTALLEFHCGGFMGNLPNTQKTLVYRIEVKKSAAGESNDEIAGIQVLSLITEKSGNPMPPGRSRFADLSSLEKGAKIGLVALSVAASVFVSKTTAKWIYAGEKDKQQHAIAGALIGALGSIVGSEILHLSAKKSVWLGIAAAIIAGLAKEGFDLLDHQVGDVEIHDAVATAGGGLFGAFAGRSVTIRFRI